ncbi:class I SAM-dependent methyltransferase [Dactylosporangium sp. NBC_01737]|uniref:O-methyltransferase n=1 Tax=Dactylosporangium sp. NBC_01737 TaxID=2975959 RepID=UPI002E0DB318|nr:class I SAM-dependent methyltransferase [Dactylosporangium sp. NBC_01737]
MDLVDAAYARAESSGFPMSCERPVGQLLAALAAGVRPGGHILELGTGAGVGVAWLVRGLGERTDVTVTSVELDPRTAAVAATQAWPSFVDLRVADACVFLPTAAGAFDLIFADAPGGKTEGLDLTIAALRPRGILAVDDMRPAADWPEDFTARQDGVRRTLVEHPHLVSVELDHGSGMVLSTRR